MNERVYYEDHNSLMKDSPLIYHHDEAHNENKLRYINLHENIEVLYFTGGKGTVLNGKNIYSVKENNIVVINSNQPHTVSSDKSVFYDCLIINKNYLYENGIDTNIVKFKSFIEKDEEITKFFNKFKELFDSESNLCTIRSKAITLLLTAYLAENYIDDTIKEIESENEMSFAISYIMRNLSKKLSLEEISMRTGYSKYYFLRKFKELTGKTPVEFINIQRCEFAKIFMINTENSISDIASAVGYESPAYFTKVFTKTVKMTPSQFISKNRRR